MSGSDPCMSVKGFLPAVRAAAAPGTSVPLAKAAGNVLRHEISGVSPHVN